MAKNNFTFGKNWKSFIRYIDEDRVAEAKKYLLDFLGTGDLNGKAFLDVGCGSGIVSLAAFLSGAKEVVSFDIDTDSVDCCRCLREKAGNPLNWKVIKGSILDEDFLSRFSQYDIVYAWGVLHHTGSMRQAIANCFGLVKRGGLFYLAIYNKKEGVFGSRFWLKVKMFYNRSSAPVRRIMEAGFIAAKCLRNPFYPCHFLKKRRRGMHSFTDVRDWLGGLPFEFASADEIMSMVPAGFEVVRTNLNKNNANLEYLFRKLG